MRGVTQQGPRVPVPVQRPRGYEHGPANGRARASEQGRIAFLPQRTSGDTGSASGCRKTGVRPLRLTPPSFPKGGNESVRRSLGSSGLPGPSAWANAAEEEVAACHHDQEADGADDCEPRGGSRDDCSEPGQHDEDAVDYPGTCPRAGECRLEFPVQIRMRCGQFPLELFQAPALFT